MRGLYPVFRWRELAAGWRYTTYDSRYEQQQNSRRAQAIRTAWRIVKDWTEAQLAIIETRMVKTEQVFLPYAIMRDNKTLYEHVESNPKFLLGSGEEQ